MAVEMIETCGGGGRMLALKLQQLLEAAGTYGFAVEKEDLHFARRAGSSL